jgi:hypothetical protein
MGRKRTRTKVTLAGTDPTVADRRSTDLLRNAQVSAMEVDDPFEVGAKILAFRSLRDDPLGRLHDRHQIDEAQYHAGRAYQHDFETAERGPRAIDPSKEAVDGGVMPEPLTEQQRKAALRLKAAAEELGVHGRKLIQDFLINGMTMEQIAQVRGLVPSQFTLKYYGARVRECLDGLAIVYDFAMVRRA